MSSIHLEVHDQKWAKNLFVTSCNAFRALGDYTKCSCWGFAECLAFGVVIGEFWHFLHFIVTARSHFCLPVDGACTDSTAMITSVWCIYTSRNNDFIIGPQR